MAPVLGEALGRDRALVETRLAEVLDDHDLIPPRLLQACRHAVLGGGKRLRACLVLESARICGAPEAAAIQAAAAIECIHAYSLVHDDLPAMDDDDLRRGKPTVHVAWDEATAILVGDGLQALAFDLIAQIRDVPADRLLRLSGGLAQASGLSGMVGGQMRDIEAETRTTPADDPMADIALIQSQKTGALIEWSAQAGAILAGADPAPFAAYARALGLAFQLRDDLLDVEGSAEEVGKAVGKDTEAGKATYVSLLGVQGTRDMAQSLVDDAIAALAPLGDRAQLLAELARFTVTRTH